MSLTLDSILPLVRHPSRYGGNEFNVVRKEWASVRLRVCLAFPDLYEIGMSHQGLRILYQVLNDQPELLAERVYAPDLDLESLLRENRLPLFSLESRRPLADFDVLGITLPYELCYTNILTILDLGGIPLRSAERDNSHPLVIGGGPCAFHPEPVAEFFDAILLGDGEEAVLEMTAAVLAAKEAGEGRESLLRRLARIQGVYVPAFFEPRYDQAGNFDGMRPLLPEYAGVERRILPDLEDAPTPHPPLAPLTRIVHDRLGLEIARGCTRGCRFCQAGMIYRPVRERSPERLLAMAEKGIDAGGFEELALLSLSTGDYSCLSDLLVRLMDTFVPRRVSVSLPSLRVGSLTPAIMEQIKRVRKTGFTLAPEAGTDRMRRVINKGITEEDLLATTRAAYGLGWQLMKLYFMFGLPTETEEDLAAIPDLAWKVFRSGRKSSRVTVSAATFVPKPHTVFEREPQLSVEEGRERVDFLKSRLRGPMFKLKWHDPRMSFLEGVLCRGDRRIGRVIEAAWRLGARLDAWTDHFDLSRWQEAADACGLRLEEALRRRGADEPLPWDHLRVGVHGKFFAEEYAKAMAEAYTPDCRVHGCQGCGVCDLKTLRPVVHRCAKAGGEESLPESAGSAPDEAPGTAATQQRVRLLYRLDYSRLDNARLLSQLELLQVFFRVFQRLHLPLNFSQGFNPTPRVSFSQALPLGTESLAEYAVVEVHEPLRDQDAWQARINGLLPIGLTVTRISPVAKETVGPEVTTFLVQLAGLPVCLDQARVAAALAAEELPLAVVRKGTERRLDLRPLLRGARLAEDGRLELRLYGAPGQAGCKPLEMAAVIAGVSPGQLQGAMVLKVKSEPAEPPA
ncbi:MAG: TIGR03960 family B12-binding radical SAM protein [Thermodesulfobacteriota bacterium]